MKPSILLAACLSVLVPLGSMLPGGADEEGQERARTAVDRGAALPLRTIYDAAGRDFEGRVLEAELEAEPDGELVYEITVLSPGGRVLKLEYDARTAMLLKAKGMALETVLNPRREAVR
jgi:uncharacterized membrane protein YkoI